MCRPGKLHEADIYILENQGRNYGADVTEIGLVSLSFRPYIRRALKAST